MNRADAPGSPAPMSLAAFDALYDELRRWDRWTDRSAGATQLVQPEDIVRTAHAVRSGRVVSMSLPWATSAAVDNPRPALHHMVDLTDNEAPEPSTNKDFLAIDYHGKATTHLDALAHIAYRGELFGGVRSEDVVTTRGATHGTVAALGPFVGRGVLLDMPAVAGVDWLEPGSAVTAEHVLRAEADLGVAIGRGDAVLLRTGHKRRRDAQGPWDSSDLSAGFHPGAMRLFADRDVAMLGSDGDSDVRPSPVPGVHSPVHILALTALGIPLLDNLDLEALAAAASAEHRWDFLFAVAPLHVPTGTGSPVNPTAIF